MRFSLMARFAWLTALGLTAATAGAQGVTSFSLSSAGVSKSIDHWGLDTAWPSADNMRHGLFHMGADQVDVVRVNFYIDEPLNGDGTLGPNTLARLNTQLALAEMAGGDKPIALTPNSGDATDAWYLVDNYDSVREVRVDRWVQVLQATRAYVEQQGMTVTEVEPFNEPDFWYGQGTPANLRSIMEALRTDTDFDNVAMVGASVLNSDNASSWYNAIKGVVDYGATHMLAGTATTYADFIAEVTAAGDVAYNPEIHSIGEALYGAENGLEGAIWWGPAYVGRGKLVKAIQGDRLGYTENRTSGTAAAVYRDPDGSVHAFAGGFERDYTGDPAMYRLHSDDGPVYFNGVGPVTDYMAYAGQNDQGTHVAIQTAGDDPMPPLDGARWKLVNRSTGQTLEVSGSGADDGANIGAGADNGGANQRWDLVRSLDGYFTLTAAHSGRTAEVADWSLDDGANVRQWGTGENFLQQWFVEQAGDGYYFVRNAHSNKLLTADSGGSVYQNDALRGQRQQWEFVLANPTLDEGLAAHYALDGDSSDETGAHDATLNGRVGYAAGVRGDAINLTGDDYATLPAGVASGDDLTVAAWVRWDGGADWQRIFDFGNDTDSYLFLSPRGGGKMRFAITTESYQNEQFLETDPLPTDEWVHVAVTLGGNTGVLYVNGEAVVAGQLLLDPSDIAPLHNYVGKSQYDDPLFDGLIDDFRVYDFALAASQIAELLEDGDLNGDGLVDAADYVVWRNTLGQTGLDPYDGGDANGDGAVDADDLAIWRKHYGQAAGGATAAVPEPGAALLLMVGALASVARRL